MRTLNKKHNLNFSKFKSEICKCIIIGNKIVLEVEDYLHKYARFI